jgi:uncharacterized protein YjlB
MMEQPQQYILHNNDKFPVLLYKGVLKLPLLFAGAAVRRLFRKNGWTNNWKDGIYTYHHYHSNTHEALAAISGSTTLELGGEKGALITFEKGDVVIIPAGVAHRNLGKEQDIICIGGYPEGKDYDMNYGCSAERPVADRKIASIPLPETDPVYGPGKGLVGIWKMAAGR